MAESSTEGLSIRAFAKLDGCTHTTVRRAVKAGKLPILANGRIHARLVGTDWRMENRRAESGTSSGTSSGTCSTTRSTTRSTKKLAAETKLALPDPHDDLFAEEANAFIDDVLAGRFRPIGDAERIKENALAAKHLLAARQQSGLVVEMEQAERVLFEMQRTQRDAWLGWPSKVAPLIAASMSIDVEMLLAQLAEHVHQQCAELGGVDDDFADAVAESRI